MPGIRSRGPIGQRSGVRYTLTGPGRYRRVLHSLPEACRRAKRDLASSPIGTRYVLSRWELAGLGGPGQPGKRSRLGTLTRAEGGVLLRPEPDLSPPRLDALRSAYLLAR